MRSINVYENSMVASGYSDGYVAPPIIHCNVCGAELDHDSDPLYVTEKGDRHTFPINVCPQHREEIIDGIDEVFEAGNKWNAKD